MLPFRHHKSWQKANTTNNIYQTNLVIYQTLQPLYCLVIHTREAGECIWIQTKARCVCIGSLAAQMFPPLLLSFLGNRFPLPIISSYPPQEHNVSFFHFNRFLISCALRTCPHQMILIPEPDSTFFCPLITFLFLAARLAVERILAFSVVRETRRERDGRIEKERRGRKLFPSCGV